MITEIATFATDVTPNTVMVGGVEKTVVNSRVAISQGRDRTTFVNVTAWGKLAAFIGNSFKKGDEIYIEGEIRNSTYKLGERSLQTNYILITGVKTTYGRKSRRAVMREDADEIL